MNQQPTMSKPTLGCSNCNQCFEAHYPYCPYCGQQAEDKLTLGVLFTNTISNYFSVDARFFRSFIPLMTRPGYLAEKFVEGKRLLYIHPAQMYLFISVVFFFLFSFVTREQAEDLNQNLKKTLNSEVVVDSAKQRVSDSIDKEKVRKALTDNKFFTVMNEKQIDSILKRDDFNKQELTLGFNEKAVDSLIKVDASDKEVYAAMGMDDDAGTFKRKLYAQILKFYKARDGGNILKTFYDTLPIALFFLLPIFALILKWFYYRKGVYAHHLVFSFYYFSFLFATFSFLVLMDLIWKDFPGWIIVLVMLSTFFYLLIALKRFYRQGWFLSFIKSSAITFAFLSLVVPLAAVIIGAFAFMFY
jgi:hypothetical protein